MCIYQGLVKNKRYDSRTKKNKERGFTPPLIDIRLEYIPTNCGNCMECRKEKANEWRVRLLEDIKTNTNGKYITLTFSNESISKLIRHPIHRTNKETGKIHRIQIKDLKGYDRDNQIATKALRLFNERWRKQHKKAIRHWMITELGHEGTENIHLHGIMWTDEHIDEIRKHWQYGYIWPRPKQIIKTWVNGQTINYMVKYISKIDKKHKEYKPIILNSPGIGKEYINTNRVNENNYKGKDTNETYRTSTGNKIKLPKYWRNKIYTEEEKERLWIDKLDKNERWVNGEKISIKNGLDEYNKAIQWARRINTELGYGSRPNANRKEHEEIQREVQIQRRIHPPGE